MIRLKQRWSKSWARSKQPRKQRKYRYNAPLHVRQGFVKALLSKELRKDFGCRSLALKKGDEIKVMRGGFKNKTGKVMRVDLKRSKIFIEGFKRKKSTGEEKHAPFEPSNLMIISINKEDKKRQKIIERKKLKKHKSSQKSSEGEK